jgi:transposase
MNEKSTTSPSQALALERFAFITQIQELLREGFPLSLALAQVSLRPMTLPDGSQCQRARRTIEDWWYDYQHGGFAALSPKERADKGQPRILNPQQQKWVLEQAQAHLAVPVKVLYRRWYEQDPQLPSLNSIYRFLREHELHTKARRAQLRQPLGGPRASAWRRRTVATLHTHHDRNQLCSPSLLPPWPARSMPPQSLRPTNSIAS